MNSDEVMENSYQTINSYMKKEEFITMLQNIRFDYVEQADIYFITGFVYNDEKDELHKRGYRIEIE